MDEVGTSAPRAPGAVVAGAEALVTELRVHGVGGATAEELLGEPHPQQVAGDGVSGFFVASERRRHRRVEAYVWGGLTSKALASAFWWVLLPFTLVNVAGYAHAEGRDRRFDGDLLCLTRLLVGLAGFLLTIVSIVYLAVLLVDVIAVQCGGDVASDGAPACGDRAWLAVLRWSGRSDVWRVTVGLIVLACLVLVVFAIARRTHRRFESFSRRRPDAVAPPAEAPPVTAPAARPHARVDAWRQLGEEWSLQDREFFQRERTTRQLFRWHLGVAATALGAVGGFAYRRVAGVDGLDGGERWMPAAVAAVAAVALAHLTRPERIVWREVAGRHETRPVREWLRLGALLTAFQWGALVAGSAAAWILTAPRGDVEAGAPLHLVRVVPPLGLASYAVLLAVTVVTLARSRDRMLPGWRAVVAQLRRGRLAGDPATERLTPPPEVARAGFRWLGPSTAVALGFMLAFAGYSAVLSRAIDVLDRQHPERLAAAAAELPRGTIAQGLPDPTLAVPSRELVGGNADTFLIALVVAAVAFGAYLWRSANGAVLRRRVRLDYAVDGPGGPAAGHARVRHGPRAEEYVAAVARSRSAAELGRNVDVLLSAFAVAFGATHVVRVLVAGGPGGAFELATYQEVAAAGWTSPLETAGAWLLVLFLFPGVYVIRLALSRTSRRGIAKVWDVLTFWPRRFHPLAAPCYAERAVPQLQDSIVKLATDTPGVVVAAHSQGTVVSYAALRWLQANGDPAVLPRVALVTFGSPLAQLFAPFFPAYFRRDDFVDLVHALHDPPGHDGTGGWVNLYRETDYIGRFVFTAGAVPYGGEARATAGGVDVNVVDPPELGFPLRTHSHYERERDVEERVEAFAASLLGQPPSSP